MDSQLEALKTEIIRERRFGKTTVAVQKIASPTTNMAVHLDSFVTSLGFTAIGDQWLSINDDDARSLLRLILTRDLAYNCEIMPDQIADRFASRFLDAFSSDCRYFTNGTIYKRQNGASWTPISEATFDTGIVCTDAATIGMIWVQDED